MFNIFFYLGEEQAAIDAPSDNSGLPGSTIEWVPSDGMEEHVPILFLDLDEDELGRELNDRVSSGSEEDFDSSESYKSKISKTKNVLCSRGHDCCLKDEQDARFKELKIVRWNDSSLVEMVDNEEVNDSLSDYIEAYDNESENSLKAIARWDSSCHQSLYLNQITPLNKDVYLTIKLNLRMKIINTNSSRSLSDSSQYVDLTLRKRIAVCVYLQSSSSNKLMSLKSFKTLLSPSIRPKPSSRASKSKQANVSGVTYRIITTVPRLLTEIENRESLAIKAASSITEELKNLANEDRKQTGGHEAIDNSLSHFERYAKTIEAVDSILKRDRAQQLLKIEKILNKSGEVIDDGTGIEMELDTPVKKTFSVPNLIKNVKYEFEFLLY